MFFRLMSGCMIQLFPFAFLCLFPFLNHFRYPKKISLTLFASMCTLLSVFFAGSCCFLYPRIESGQMMYDTANLIFMANLIPCAALYFYVVKASWQQKMIVLTFCLSAALALTTLERIIDETLYAYHIVYNEADGLPYVDPSRLVLLCLSLVIVPGLAAILRFAYVPVVDKLNRKEENYISFLSLILFVALTTVLVPTMPAYDMYDHPYMLIILLALFLIIFLLYLIIFRAFYYMHREIEIQHELSQTQHLVEIQESQYRSIYGLIENDRRIRHDLRHHLLTLQGYLQKGNLDDALRYTEQYFHVLEQCNMIKFCDNTVTNTILSYYQSIALSKNISFTAHVQLPEKLSIREMDISVLLGNLLENALEASANAADPYISLNIISPGKMIVVTIDNSFDGNVNFDGQSYLSTKEQKSGLGLKSVRHIAKKYNGDTQFSHGQNVFHSSVILNN